MRDSPHVSLEPGDRARIYQNEWMYIEIIAEEGGTIRVRTNDQPLAIYPMVSNEIRLEHGRRDEIPL